MLTNWNIAFWEYDYFAPQWLWLLCIVPVVVALLIYKERQRRGEWKFSGDINTQKKLGSRKIWIFRQVFIGNMAIILCMIILAMAKPYNWNNHDAFNKDYKNGIDIILTIDVSLSMTATDFKPNRIEAAKRVAKEFLDGRSTDRIGLVAYAGEAYTACPATLDYTVLKKEIDRLDCDLNIEGGTAIGVGLGTAVTRLRSDSIPSKVIILLTDGSNNSGTITPDEAADLAAAKNIRVYTIGVGATGEDAVTVVSTPFGTMMQSGESDLDEATLQRIAAKTEGKYFRATDEKSLRAIYQEIETMEKRRIIDRHFQSEPPAMPAAFLNVGMVLMLLGWIVPLLIFRFNE